MSMTPGKFDARSGDRVMSACLAAGREECMSWSRSGRRYARTKVVRSVAWSGNEAVFTGIEGMYLKLGKRNAEAVAEEKLAAGAIDEFVTKTLLKG
jgi:hypothetical protein